MSIQVALHHLTAYTYERPIALSPQVIRLRPAPHCRTSILSYSQKITPQNHFINWQQDPFNNHLARVVFPEKTREFKIEIDLIADLAVINPFDFFLETEAEQFPFSYTPSLRKDLEPYLITPEPGPFLKKFLDKIDRSPKHTVSFLVDINQQLKMDINYLIRMEPNIQTPENTLKLKSGSCRDSAWLLVEILRNLGLATRFVSGYLIQLKPDIKPVTGPAGAEEDFTDLHAWVEVYIPGAGWIGLDPTSGLLAGEGHIPLAASPQPQSAAPVTGFLEPVQVEFQHKMSVTRILETPRSTRPYPEETWQQIYNLGLQIDQKLDEHDVRLTMGGEPTFVAVNDMDGAEWNTAAVGPTKRNFASLLIKKLKNKWAPGGFLYYGQGKWYPGESLPRWAFSCYWRKDRNPLWKNPKWIGDESIDYGFGVNEARKFIETLTEILGLSPKYIKPAYEDIFYFLWKEQRIPVNVNPLESKLSDAEERTRLARVFEAGLGEITGFVLPLRYGSWKSSEWPLKSSQLFLVPGDSPAGLRLPLDSLPWISLQEYPQIIESDPMGYFPPSFGSSTQQRKLYNPLKASPKEEIQEQTLPDENISPSEIIRTALSVQPRDGKIFVFMPPMAASDHYFQLITAIENVCETTQMPVIIEGYLPPFDPNLEVLKITPDPGVLEVNIPPQKNWSQMVQTTTDLYEEARQCHLGSEKFMLDGRHTGTGGGNHIVLGGKTPADSPFLRRPDLLRSMVSYFINHPSLSYLFSGLFIGPTSQNPRIDEARQDSLYELEIAFHELDRLSTANTTTPLWLVDRLFRNLLVDITGNTHRAEFCIDKLFSPDSATGRLGLVEMRGFEMPPHAQMSLAQQLLLRALVAWFWEKPYRQKLTHWGNSIHDKFMLPYFIQADLDDVLRDLNENGFSFSRAFFHPHFEFRYPLFGNTRFQNIELEIRQAMEPWNVLGEEPGAGGTVRNVDSSLERLQVKISGLQDSRYIATVNGRRLPLHATNTNGVFVAGVRYRAWQPPSCLHPTIGVHTPLIFDVIDTHNQRSIMGAVYHVGHPGGRNYKTFPVNENEAEGRRASRFSSTMHSPGKISAIPPEEINVLFPHTLDLRLPFKQT